MEFKNKFSMAMTGVAMYALLIIAFFEQSFASLAIPIALGVPDIFRDAPNDKGAGGADPKVSGKNDLSPAEEFRQLGSELKNLVSTKHERTESEFKAQFEKISERMDDLEFSFESYRKSTLDNVNETKGFQHADTFKNAFWRFVKNQRDGLTLESLAPEGKREAKSYHPSLPVEHKSENLVRFDFASSGALLMPAELSQEILRNAIETTPATRLVMTTTTSRAQKKRNLRVSTPGIHWVEEEGATPKGKMTYRQVTLTPKKAAARYGASIENEQDSGYDLFAEMRLAYEEDFRAEIGKQILSGDGNGKPKGMIGELTNFNSAGLALTSDMLIKFVETIQDVYQQNAQWLFTRQTRAYIRSLLVSDEATQYLWEPDFTRRSPTLLLGAPINIAAIDDMAGALSGNFNAGQVPVLYGNFQMAYEFTTHTDMFIIDDPYTESANWVRNLNIMSRVDGQPMKTEAAAQLTITNP